MLIKNVILNLPGLTVKKVVSLNPMVLEVSYRWVVRCIHCNSKQLRKKDSFIRSIRHEAIGLRPVLLRIKAHKYYCKDCHRYFNQRFAGVLKYQRATEKLREQVYHQHTQGICQKTLAQNFKLGKATVERWYHHGYQRLNQHLKTRDCPQVLGIDEHFFSKKQGYATTLCDLRKHKVFDVVKGKSAKDLASYLNELPGKERVKVVCIDLSSSYKSLVQKYFPNAKIVADRFHVIKLINQFSLQAYQEIDPQMKYHRGTLSILRTRLDRLSEKQRQKRDDYLRQQPAIRAMDQFKQRLHSLLMIKHRKAKQCKRLLPIFLKMVKELKQAPFKALARLGRTLYQWREEIVRMWRFTKNNGITEGFHRKMKLIQRRAYGFRNFENYRLRVRVLCS